MARFESERELLDCFDERYLHVRSPVMMEIEAEAHGTDYGAQSWSTIEHVEAMAAHLDLGKGHRLLDIGAGAGWPGLHIGLTTGCEVTMLDFPINGLKVGLARATDDGVEAVAAVADASRLPFAREAFEGVIHSDVLCCLSHKREALVECRRVVRSGGKLAFTVIEVRPGLTALEQEKGVEAGPEYVESERPYAELLAETGWVLIGARDLTDDFSDLGGRLLVAREARRDRLVELLGRDDVEETLARNRGTIASIEEGLLRRCMYLAEA
jgi:SAM-dependent methyltransferase